MRAVCEGVLGRGVGVEEGLERGLGRGAVCHDAEFDSFAWIFAVLIVNPVSCFGIDLDKIDLISAEVVVFVFDFQTCDWNRYRHVLVIDVIFVRFGAISVDEISVGANNKLLPSDRNESLPSRVAREVRLTDE